MTNEGGKGGIEKERKKTKGKKGEEKGRRNKKGDRVGSLKRSRARNCDSLVANATKN